MKTSLTINLKSFSDMMFKIFFILSFNQYSIFFRLEELLFLSRIRAFDLFGKRSIRSINFTQIN